MEEENQRENLLKAINNIEKLIDEHSDSAKPYSEVEISKILSDLYDVRKILTSLEDKYLNLVEEHDDIASRVKAMENKLDDMNKQETLKHDRTIKYIDYVVYSIIGSLVGLYISKLVGGK